MHSFDHYYCNHSKWAINDLLIATQREHNDSKMIISSIGAVKVLVLIVHVNFNYPFKLGHKVGPAYYIPVCNILAILRYFYLQNCRNIGWYFSMPHTSHKKIKPLSAAAMPCEWSTARWHWHCVAQRGGSKQGTISPSLMSVGEFCGSNALWVVSHSHHTKTISHNHSTVWAHLLDVRSTANPAVFNSAYTAPERHYF